MALLKEIIDIFIKTIVGMIFLLVLVIIAFIAHSYYPKITITIISLYTISILILWIEDIIKAFKKSKD